MGARPVLSALFPPRSVSVACVVLLAGCPAKKNTGLTPAAVAAARSQCAYSPGQLASATVPSQYPTGSQIPIDHIVLIMEENRSFDHMLSGLTGDVDVASPTATNPDEHGNPVSRFHNPKYCFDDTAHGWSSVHTELDGNLTGRIDGFVVANEDPPNDPLGIRAMGYYTAEDIPYQYALAQTFAISDRHFCSVLGPTWPNRFFYMAGRSFGFTENNPAPINDPQGNPYPNMFTELDAAHVSWQVYSQDVPTPAILIGTYAQDLSHFVPETQFASDLQNGTLASVSMVEGTDLAGGGNVDQHPPGDVQIGEQFIATIVNGVMSSPYWKNTVIFITYDEEGGLYDHVLPPAACPPDDLPPDAYADAGPAQPVPDAGPPPDAGSVADAGPAVPDGGPIVDVTPFAKVPGGFNQYGFRVPLFVVSPYVKRGYVSHAVTDHTSILRFVEDRFGLPAITKRDANADPFMDIFDFDHPDFSTPTLPAAPLDPTQAAACKAEYPPSGTGF